jgi:hypothetical protein
VIDPGAAPRVFGIPTAQLERFVADERNVLWSANGCLHASRLRCVPVYSPTRAIDRIRQLVAAVE